MRFGHRIVLALAALAGFASAQDEPIGTVIGIDLGKIDVEGSTPAFVCPRLICC